MRTTHTLTAAVTLASALLLTACDDGGGADDGKADTGGVAACGLGDVEVRVDASPAPAAGDTGTVTVSLARSGGPCTLDGFPAVTLAADGTTAEVPKDQAAAAQKLTLAEGGEASFTLTYVRGEAGGSPAGLAVRTARFALPGDAETRDVPWSYGEVALKAGKPDATVGAFQQAGD
ncbi:DUF4232 domain-containing protein [Streptomyces sp. NPDC003717]|uniref:DUF4232 domain-containing protein n=1 Tax=Streptomyces sp. NPDC003717 TaxID=3154276 RepID=UPI0033AA2483